MNRAVRTLLVTLKWRRDRKKKKSSSRMDHFAVPLALGVTILAAMGVVVACQYSRTERDAVRHYVQHGDRLCRECRRGFDFYWVKGVR